jgi:hypothetical protein
MERFQRTADRPSLLRLSVILAALRATQRRIAGLRKSIVLLPAATLGAVPANSRRSGEPVPQIRIPPSYLAPLNGPAAALIGYPLAGFLGSFFAVPAVGLAHVLVKQAIATRKEKGEGQDTSREAPERPAPTPEAGGKQDIPIPVHAGTAGASH